MIATGMCRMSDKKNPDEKTVIYHIFSTKILCI